MGQGGPAGLHIYNLESSDLCKLGHSKEWEIVEENIVGIFASPYGRLLRHTTATAAATVVGDEGHSGLPLL